MESITGARNRSNRLLSRRNARTRWSIRFTSLEAREAATIAGASGNRGSEAQVAAAGREEGEAEGTIASRKKSGQTARKCWNGFRMKRARTCTKCRKKTPSTTFMRGLKKNFATNTAL